jgi:hypothetical protein
MRDDKCMVELRPDKRHTWVLQVGEGCGKVLEDIYDDQGPFSRQYLKDRLVFPPEEHIKQRLSFRAPVDYSIPNLNTTL